MSVIAKPETIDVNKESLVPETIQCDFESLRFHPNPFQYF